MKFDKVISIGHSCVPAHQIRKWLNQQEAYFFDWLVTPPPALITLIRCGLMTLFDKSRLAIHEPGKNKYVPIIHTEMKVIFYHEFRKEKELTDYSIVYSKYLFLSSRLNDLLKSQSKVLFIRHHIKKEECEEVQKAIAEAYPKLCFEILAVNECDPSTLNWNVPGIHSYHVNNVQAWHGDDNQWLDVFKKVGIYNR